MPELDLPFQWDDGTCISPFVPTTGDSVVELAAWIDRSVLPRSSTCTMRVTDLGCGDGTPLLVLCAELFSGRGPKYPLEVMAVGFDIDEGLVAKAKRAADEAASVVPPPHILRHNFAVADLRETDIEKYFPVDEADGHVLFLYLLPDALEIIREMLLKVIRRVRMLVSNRWDLPFLCEWKVGQLNTLHIYCYNDEARKTWAQDLSSG
uniref:WGS project CAEQ00000000 data, annotated contig 20 n=1 Tax=Trypanosoma congolense (strain IL3000) TaxID=1068625 RepID=F9WAT9_TRYCI|nr:unnamed protein product [Trypanosoma congolense IL3000]